MPQKPSAVPLDETTISVKIAEVVELAKKHINRDGKADGKAGRVKGLWPEYYEGYNRKVREWEDIKNHSIEGVFPERLFSEPAPNQEKHEFEYMKANYKNTTLPIFSDFVNTITRPWHKSNWSITYQDDADQFKVEGLQGYLDSGLPVYGSLENFAKTTLPALKIRDPEGVVAVKPYRIPTIEKEDGSRVIDGTQLVDPGLVYYTVKQVIHFGDDFVMVELKEKSEVSYGSAKRKTGFIFEFYDENALWRATQVGKQVDYTFEIEQVYQHDNGEIPVYKLTGIPKAEDDGVTYQSPFLFAVPNLDLVTIYQADLQATIKKCAFPYRIMLGDVCEFVDKDTNTPCNGGVLAWFNEDRGETVTRVCPECNGAGLKSRVSRLGEMLLRPKDQLSEGDSDFSDPMRYVSPQVDTMEFMRTEIQEHENRARRILHLNTTNDMAKPREDGTATAQAIDQKAMAAFIEPVSNQMFALYGKLIDAIGKYRYGNLYRKPSIQQPTTFDFSTEEDFVMRLSEASKAKVPPVIIRQIVMQYIESVYVNDDTQGKVFKLITKADRLLALSLDEINMKVARGTVAKWEEVLHCSPLTLVGELREEDKDFLDKPFKAQRAALVALSKQKAEEIGGTAAVPEPTPEPEPEE